MLSLLGQTVFLYFWLVVCHWIKVKHTTWLKKGSIKRVHVISGDKRKMGLSGCSLYCKDLLQSSVSKNESFSVLEFSSRVGVIQSRVGGAVELPLKAIGALFIIESLVLL